MLETYAAEVAGLPPAHFATLMQSLEFGLQHSDTQVVQASLEGLAGGKGWQRKSLAFDFPGPLARPGSARGERRLWGF